MNLSTQTSGTLFFVIFCVLVSAHAAIAVEPVALEPKAVELVAVDEPIPLKPDLNANVASIVEAARTGDHPERLSPLKAPAPFDPAAFRANAKAYLDVSEPGRCFQTATPGEKVPVLTRIGRGSLALKLGTGVALQVRAPAGAPTSFLSLALGTFDNQLTSITVVADAEGVATATYYATPGVTGEARVLAGSPLASGQVTFQLSILDGKPAPKPPVEEQK